MTPESYKKQENFLLKYDDDYVARNKAINVDHVNCYEDLLSMACYEALYYIGVELKRQLDQEV